MVHPDTEKTDETENVVLLVLVVDMDLLVLKVLSVHPDCVILLNATLNSPSTPRDLMEVKDLSRMLLPNQPKKPLLM